MMDVERPDLSNVDPQVIAYIEKLEAELARHGEAGSSTSVNVSEFQATEPPTTYNLIIFSQRGMVKRTPRHLYIRQLRGGMGVFDLETGEDDHPSLLTVADVDQHLLLFSNFGRAFRLPVESLTEAPVRSRGEPLAQMLPFRPHERIAAVLPDDGGSYVVLASQRGWVRRIRSSYLGSNLIPGMTFHDVKEGGYLTAACWTQGDGDLFLVTREGKGIRFSESQVPARGCLGIRVHIEDRLVAITAVHPESGVFLAGGDGKGTIRLMSGFSANKAPGGGGKIAMKGENVVGAVTVDSTDDLFVVSHLNKMIRFSAGDVPPKTGVVQGVNCMSLRADTVTAVTSSTAQSQAPNVIESS